MSLICVLLGNYCLQMTSDNSQHSIKIVLSLVTTLLPSQPVLFSMTQGAQVLAILSSRLPWTNVSSGSPDPYVET